MKEALAGQVTEREFREALDELEESSFDDQYVPTCPLALSYIAWHDALTCMRAHNI